MQFNAKDLTNALRLIKPAVVKRATLPILEGVKLVYTMSPGSGYVTLSATNLDIAMSTTIQDTSPYIDPESSQVVNYKQLRDFVNPKGGPVTLEDGRVEQDGCTVTLETYDPLDYPYITECRTAPAVTLNRDEWGMVQDRVVPFTCDPKDESRPALNHVLTEITPDSVTFGAADGYRLSVMTLPRNTDNAAQIQKIHRLTLDAIPKTAESVSFHLMDEGTLRGFIVFSVKGQVVYLYHKCSDWHFPDLRQVFPKTGTASVMVKSSVVEAAAKTKLDRRTHPTLVLEEGSAVLNKQQTWNHDSVSIEGCEYAAFNPQYLVSLLPLSNDGYLTLQGTGHDAPWMVKDATTTMVIMPVVGPGVRE